MFGWRTSRKAYLASTTLIVNTFLLMLYMYVKNGGLYMTLDRKHQSAGALIDEQAEKRGFESIQVPEHPPFERNLESRMVSWPWKDDRECSRHSVRLGKNIPLMLLASFPRSGNTWLRYLLEGATGIFTGSVYEDVRLIALGYLGETEEPSAGTVLVVKDHFTRAKSVDATVPAVLIIRNPEHSLTSFHAFRTVEKDTAFFDAGNEEVFKKRDFKSMVYKEIKQWELVATLILKNVRYLHVVLYEDLKSNPLQELLKVLKFLRVPEDADRLRCLERHSEGSVNRGQPKFDPYSNEQRKMIAEAVRRVSELMVERGWPPLPYVEIVKTDTID